MWLSFSGAVAGVRVVAKYALPPTNPFSAYADVFPEHAASVMDGHGFSCEVVDVPQSPPVSVLEKDCRLEQETGIFTRINVMISNEEIHQISFILHENTLRVGDLAVFLEATDFRELNSTLFFSWHGNLGIAYITSTIGRFSPFQYVWHVSLINMLYPLKN
jgi:hypothetical protein